MIDHRKFPARYKGLVKLGNFVFRPYVSVPPVCYYELKINPHIKPEELTFHQDAFQYFSIETNFDFSGRTNYEAALKIPPGFATDVNLTADELLVFVERQLDILFEKQLNLKVK